MGNHAAVPNSLWFFQRQFALLHRSHAVRGLLVFASFSAGCMYRRPAGGDPRASSSTRGFPKECTAAFAPPALRPAFVGLAVTMVVRLAPESTHRSPRYSDRLAP